MLCRRGLSESRKDRKREYHRDCRMSQAEIMVIKIMFHSSNQPLKIKSFVEFIYGKLVGDKGYIGIDLFSKLFIDGIQLVTKLKNNMKGGIRSMYDRILLRKRAIIKTINDELKNIAQIEIPDIVPSRILL